MHFVVLLVKGDSAFEMQLNSFFEYLTNHTKHAAAFYDETN